MNDLQSTSGPRGNGTASHDVWHFDDLLIRGHCATANLGDEAVEFFEAHANAICSQDIYDVVAFHDAEVTVDYRAVMLGQFQGQLRQGRHEMARFLDICLFAPTSEISIYVLAKLSMLHELAHPWLEANINPQRRQTFVGLTNTTSWHDESAAWDERGVEWAAEILAWGLLDRPMELLRLGFPACDLRFDAFRILVNTEPRNVCETATS